ncbi:MAG: DUF115 domain-containing protein [Magnetococcales bacterium]|nr:DUF115 domain-containing protein [Magnetococcales bacterium]
MGAVETVTERKRMDFGPILQNNFGEYYLPAINQEIFSQSGADTFYHRHFGETLQKKDALYLIVGTDSGRLLHWLLAQGLADGSRYLFIEYPELVDILREEADFPADLPNAVQVCAPDGWLEVAKELALQDYCYLGHVYRIKSLAVLDGFFEEYFTTWKTFEEQISQYQTTANRELGSRVFMIKGLENLAENRIPAERLIGLFPGKTAILLAGGPSLPESFPWVLANRDNLVVLAVSRIASQLARAGIQPDFFFAIDPHDIIFHQSKAMLACWQHTLLVNVYHLNPRLLSQWRGPSAYMGQLFPWESALNPARPLSFPGITVSHQALGMAIEMGFAQVVLSGFDLCFDKDGFTHTEGSEERKAGPFAAPLELWVETNGGWQAETRYDFLSAIPSLEQLAAFAVQRGCRVVNPAPGAARIAQVDHLPWETLVVTPLAGSVWERIQTAIPPETTADRMHHYETVVQELLRVRTAVQQVLRLTSEALDCNERFFGRKGRPPDFKFKLRMDAIEQELDEVHAHFALLVKRWGVADFLKLSRPDKEREWTDQEIEEAGRRYYQIYRESAVALTRLLDEIRQRLRARMEEEKAHPAIKILVSQWKKDNQPGRLQVFLDRRGQEMADFPEGVQKTWQGLLADHQHILAETETDYKAYLFQNMATPQAIRSRVINLFRQKDGARLLAFAQGLEKSAAEAVEAGDRTELATTHKEQYVWLIQGMVAELEGDPARSARWLEKITSPLLTTDALQRLLTIALTQGDLSAALPIAKRLSEWSPVHIPHYGDVLRLLGRREEAVAVYSGFVKIVKNDWVTLLKLGKLHNESSNPAAARQRFEQILHVDPDNKAALLFLQQLSSTEPARDQP